MTSLESKPVTESKNNKTVADNFVLDYISDVKRYSVEKLAGILASCVEYKGPLPRNMVDWYIAERHINETIGLEDFAGLTKEFLILTAYSELKKSKGLPEINLSKITYKLSNQDDYKKEINRINEIVNRLSYSEFNDLIRKPNLSQRREYQDRFLGREIWDRGYQTIKKDALRNYDYCEIRFG